MKSRNNCVLSNNTNEKCSKFLNTQLPSNPLAEASVLCSLINDRASFHRISGKITEEFFFSPINKIIFTSAVSILEAVGKIDGVLLCNDPDIKKLLKRVDGEKRVKEVISGIPEIDTVDEHLKILLDYKRLRKVIIASVGIIVNCQSERPGEVEDIIETAERDILAATSPIDYTGDFSTVSSILGRTLGMISAGIDPGVETGFESIDSIICGMRGGDLVVLAARPSMGKTALALNIACNVAAEGKSVGFFSIEMPASSLSVRMLSSFVGISLQDIMQKRLGHTSWESLTSAASVISNYKFYIDDSASLTALQLKSKARKLKLKSGVDLLIIDYLQLMQATGTYESRNVEVSNISRSLKEIAKELNIPVIALAQLSRSVESRPDRRPRLSDLRDSGAIEQDADIVMFLYRDVIYNRKTEDPGAAEVLIKKNRNGAIGTATLNFNALTTTFTNSYIYKKS